MIFSRMSEVCKLHSSQMILILLKPISEIHVCSFELAKKDLCKYCLFAFLHLQVCVMIKSNWPWEALLAVSPGRVPPN